MEMKKSCSHHHVGLALLLVRIALGGIFLYAGILKLINMDMTIGFFAQAGIPAWLTWIVALVETVGGGLVVFGILARWAAVPLIVVLIIAIILVKSQMGFPAMQVDLVLIVMGLVLILMGSGKYSLFKKHACEGTCDACEGGKCCSK